jgi:hypothetical protein
MVSSTSLAILVVQFCQFMMSFTEQNRLGIFSIFWFGMNKVLPMLRMGMLVLRGKLGFVLVRLVLEQQTW